MRTLRQAERLRRAGEELAELFTRLAADRRCEPRDDVLGLLSAAEVDGRLDPRDLVATCGLLLVAGFETTVNLIGNGMAALHRHPDQWRALVDDSALGAAVVEETLRWDPPVQATGRIADVDAELDGREVPRARRWP